MRKIFKYHLNSLDRNVLDLPIGAKILCVQTQVRMVVVYGHQPQPEHGIFMWAEVDTSRNVEQRTFKIYATGEEITDDECFREYVGTVQTGNTVWHVFEIISSDR